MQLCARFEERSVTRVISRRDSFRAPLSIRLLTSYLGGSHDFARFPVKRSIFVTLKQATHATSKHSRVPHPSGVFVSVAWVGMHELEPKEQKLPQAALEINPEQP